MLPEEYVQTMKPLRANAPEMALRDVYKVIRDDLKIEVGGLARSNLNKFSKGINLFASTLISTGFDVIKIDWYSCSSFDV